MLEKSYRFTGRLHFMNYVYSDVEILDLNLKGHEDYLKYYYWFKKKKKQMINKYIYVNSTSCGSITQRERRFNKKIAQHSRNTLETFFLLLNFCIVMPLVMVSKNKTFYKEFR